MIFFVNDTSFLPDSELNVAIYQELIKGFGSSLHHSLYGYEYMSEEDVAGLTYLSAWVDGHYEGGTWVDAHTRPIRDLSGLEKAISLRILDLSNTQINNISALTNLTNLQEIHLENTQLSDISPLVSNQCIGAGDELWLDGNQLTIQAVQDIETLRARGVTVYWSGTAVKSPPTLTGSDSIIIGSEILIQFPEDQEWSTSINNLTVDGTELTSGQYTVGSSSITIESGVLSVAGSHTIEVSASGYLKASIKVLIQPKVIVNSLNGHYYALITKNITWEDSKNEAASLTLNGVNGHLATITSEEENRFVTGLGNVAYHWLGGEQTNGSQEPSGGWQWITGEEWSYSNWDGGQPDNYNSNENALEYFTNDGHWNDAPKGPDRYEDAGYIVEFDTPPLTTETFTVNNPSTKGFIVTLNPKLAGLTASSFTLRDSSNQSVPVTGATTSDNGATYAISAAMKCRLNVLGYGSEERL